jgi:hypothetical protein
MGTGNVILEAIGLAAMIVAKNRKPDFVIGGEDAPYLRRWFVREEGPSGGCYLHQILRDDDDRALHDHPWDAMFYIIEGSYREITPEHPDGIVYGPGSFRHVKAEQSHRLVVVDGPVWTLAFLGPRRREWGFHCPNGWRHWKEFVSDRDKGMVGKGCE